MAIWALRSDGVNDYVQGSLVSVFSGDFTLRAACKIESYESAGDFANILSVSSSGGDYLGIALNSSPSNLPKIISNGKTPGTGSTVINLDQDYILELRYVSSTNTASFYIDGVFEYSVSPTGGSSWIPTLDLYRLFSGNGTSSYGNISISDDTKVIDLSTPANTIELTPTLSDGIGSVLNDASANAKNGTLFNFTGTYWVGTLAKETVITEAVPNLTTTATQGLCRDSDHFYMFDSNATGSVPKVKKVDLAGVVVANTTDFGNTNLKPNDGAVGSGVIYNIMKDTANNNRWLITLNSSTLALINSVDVTNINSDGKYYSASVCFGSTGNLFALAYVIDVNDQYTARNVIEMTTAGVYVATHTMDYTIYGSQGITWDGTSYFVSSHDIVRGLEVFYTLSSSFSVLNEITPNTVIAEMEGIEYYNGVYYYNDINEVPRIFKATILLTAEVAEQGPSFTESITANLSPLPITVSLAESGPSFTESINATVTSTVSITATLSEQGPVFTDSITTNLTTSISALISESGPNFIESIIANIPVVITVNPKNIVRVKRKSNTVTIKRKSNIVRVR